MGGTGSGGGREGGAWDENGLRVSILEGGKWVFWAGGGVAFGCR